MSTTTIFTLLFLFHWISYSAQTDPCMDTKTNTVCAGLLKDLCNPSDTVSKCTNEKRKNCTTITPTFLFKETLKNTGKDWYQNYQNETVHLCRPNDYNETIENIVKLFELKLGAECDPSVEKRLLIDTPRYVNSLSARLDSLEDIAHRNRLNSKMCQLHKLQYCDPDKSNPGTGKCVCFYGANQGKDVENCYAGFFGTCGKYIPAHDEATPNQYSFSPFNKNNLHLPFVILDPTQNTLNCSKLSSDDSKTYDCDNKTNRCVCPTGESCSGGSPDALLEYDRKEKHELLGLGNTEKELEEFKKVLASVQIVMTGKFGDTCSAPNDIKLKEVDRFMRDFVENGNKKVEDFIKAGADLKVIVDDPSNETDAKFCQLKRNATGAIIRTEGVAERIPCEQHPYFLDSNSNPVFYCVPTDEDFKVEDAESILKNISQPQNHSMPCNRTNEDILVKILQDVIDIFHNKLKDTVDDQKLRKLKFEILELERVNFNKTNLCNNQPPFQGLRCIGGKCECSPNYVLDATMSLCLVRIGGTCHECKKRKPFIPCDPNTTKTDTGLKCEGEAKCLTPYGSDMFSKQCIVEKIDPQVTAKPGSSAFQFLPNSKIIFVLGLELFVF